MFSWKFPSHLTFFPEFPEFSVEWFVFRKFNNFRIFCYYSQEISVPFVPVSRISKILGWIVSALNLIVSTVVVVFFPYYTKHFINFNCEWFCDEFTFNAFIAVCNSVMSGCMTSHWQQAMKMLRLALVNCQLKTWKNCAANREELKRKLKKTRKVEERWNHLRKVVLSLIVNADICKTVVFLFSFFFFACSNQWRKRSKRQREESGSVKRTTFGIGRISQGNSFDYSRPSFCSQPAYSCNWREFARDFFCLMQKL